MRAAVIVVALLAGCAASSIEIPKETKVQVPVACIPPGKRTQKPAVRTEDDLWAIPEYQRTIAAWSDLKKLRDIYLPSAEALLDGCSNLPR